MKRAIIGGGMSGLVCAIASAKNGVETQVFERNNRVGKKISMTGNGKCNILNSNVSKQHFNQSRIVDIILNSVPVSHCLEFLQSIGIFTYSDQNGRIYPITDNANSVIDCLRFQCQKLGVKIHTDCNIFSVDRTPNGNFSISTQNKETHLFQQVVLACGSPSQSQNIDLSGILPKQYMTKQCPSLVPVKIKNMDKLLNGLRVKTTVKLLNGDGNILQQQEGEVQFKDYGLTGICIMNLSTVIARNIVLGKIENYTFEIDLTPAMQFSQLKDILQDRIESNTPTEQLFLGILHNKIAETVLQRCNSLDIDRLAKTIKCFTFKFDRLLDYSMSQVTAGGISENFVDQNLMLPNGIFAIGEILNVDGICGGFNLYFAIASALHLAKNLVQA